MSSWPVLVFDIESIPDVAGLRALLRRVEGPKAELRPVTLAPMPSRAVLLRLQNNIKLRRLRAGALEPALACAEDMLRIAPDQSELWRQSGVLNQKLHRVSAAAECYRKFLELVPEGAAAVAVRAQLDILKTMLN